MKARHNSSAGKPIEIRQGNATVKIYSGKTVANGTQYPQFSLVYYDGTNRVRRRFSDLEEAKREAEMAAIRLANGENEVLRLTPADRTLYLQAVEFLKPFGKPLNLAVAEYVEALRLLPAGTSLKEAAADFARRRELVRESRNVPELVAEYLAAKERAGKSERHLKDLRLRLGRFAEAFPEPVVQLTGPRLQSWLDALPVSNRSKLNELRVASALLRFAVRRKYAQRELQDELDAVEKPESRPGETPIFSPDELRELFSAAKPELIPWLAMGAFCGLRSAEILRLDWREVHLDRGHVEVKAVNAKTAQRRLVPLCESAKAWLAPHAHKEGRVACHVRDNWFYQELTSAVNRARKQARVNSPFKWKRNGLRHSFCSYRLALINDAPRTALEAGNSPAMIFKHYREIVTEDEARAWFAVAPVKAEGIIPMPAAVA